MLSGSGRRQRRVEPTRQSGLASCDGLLVERSLGRDLVKLLLDMNEHLLGFLELAVMDRLEEPSRPGLDRRLACPVADPVPLVLFNPFPGRSRFSP